MSDTPASIDAILASIRARVLGPADAPADEAPLANAPAAPAADERPAPRPPRPISASAPLTLADISLSPAASTTSLEELIRSMLAGQIQAWLDANMPEIVERLAREEISRLTAKP